MKVCEACKREVKKGELISILMGYEVKDGLYCRECTFKLFKEGKLCHSSK